MSQRVDFSRNANVYDRRHGAVLHADAARDLAAAAGLQPNVSILDIGAGTGRVTIALANIGCRVIAIDPAQPMLQALRSKAAGLPVNAIAGEGAQLPFRESQFDAVVLARVLYVMPDWREVLRDVVRVLKPEGRLLHEWGNGSADEEWVQIREKARALFEQAGVLNPFHPGARSEGDVDEFLSGQGMVPSAKIGAGPGACMTLAEFLSRIDNGECSYIWNVPAEVQRRCLPELRAWAERTFDVGRPTPMPRETSWKIYRKPSYVETPGRV